MYAVRIAQFKTDADVLQEEHRFLRDDTKDPEALAEYVLVLTARASQRDCAFSVLLQLEQAHGHPILQQAAQALRAR